ncbi:hypothetical protein DWB58_28525, partial [candidate division KSB1 bacterium]|nr:hypothetical protein [candidate division KSB1 bacterium]
MRAGFVELFGESQPTLGVTNGLVLAVLANFLFFRKSQSAFKVLTLIKDVPPSRIMEITKRT